MKYFVVEIGDGGAEGEEMTEAQVEEYLGKSRYWAKPLRDFKALDKKPGVMFTYPCGWVFIVC